MTDTDPNPLLSGADPTPFDRIAPEHVAPALDVLLADSETALARSVGPDVAADYDALSVVLDVPVERLSRTWSHVNHLQGVADTPALRAAHTAAQPRVVEFFTRLGADARLFAKYKAAAAAPSAGLLGPAQRKALDDALRNFVLGGAELQGTARAQHAANLARQAELSQRFGEHALDATDAFALFVDEDALDGVPADVRQAARDAAAAAGRSGCKLTLKSPCYVPVLTYATDRTLREQLFRAHATRASELGPPEHDNTALMQELITLRQQEAELLGKASYADLALVAKMAGSPARVLGFVRDLAGRARPHAERDLADVRAFAAEHLGLPELQPWDRAFASEKLKQDRYAFGSDELKRYFTEPRVLQGLFDLIHRLLGVAIHETPAPVWHPSVRHYTVSRGGAPVASFYLDLHARAGKHGGAWMDDSRQRWARPDGSGLQLPVAHLVCNFAPPVGGQPALLTHDDLITLFHEFGHGLHHMLTTVDERAVAGIAGVERDATELPSQFMENFCWEWGVLQQLTAHVDTGEPLPRALFDRMLAARNFQSGLQLTRQCEFALFDMRAHHEAGTAARVLELAREVNAEVSVVPAAPFVRYPHSFTHLFDGGYAAGYYGYAWALVLAADAYSAFEEAGIFDPATGARWRTEILEAGGSRPAMESFVAFRGREPRLDALLRHQGMT